MTEADSFVRYSSPLTIQYILVSNHRKYTDNEFNVNSFNLLRTLPIELIQLEDSVDHFEFCFRFRSVKSYELFSFPSDFFNLKKEAVVENLEMYSKNFGVQSLIKIFIIDGTLENHSSIAEILKDIDFCYYILIGGKKENASKYFSNFLFNNTDEFIKYLRRDIKLINNKLAQLYKERNEVFDSSLKMQINPSKAFISTNNVPGAILTWNNYFILNQIIGNFWLGINSKIGGPDTLPEKRAEELVGQCKRIDNLYKILYTHEVVKPTDPFQPLLPTLVLIQPYHYPKREKLIGKKLSKIERKWTSILNSEQNLKYEHLIPDQVSDKISEQEVKFLMRRNLLRLMFLDNTAYIHSMFTYSPIVRLPQIGKSINLELSHLQKITPIKNSTISNIEKFGKKLSRITLNANIKNYIKERNGQIFAISDLPLEWLYLDEYPLCLTHDVCRIPEFNLNSIANNAIHLQRNLFQIPENLIDKTLVVHCASKNDTPMNNMFKLIDRQKNKLGFTSVNCSTVAEISIAVKKFKPELLIFDCHGRSDIKERSSFLVINNELNEILNGEDIIKHEISAPLVFLSACETFPNYGYVKLLSDAFMQVGAYCVTTTFLSINIIDAATIIVRLLNNLHQLKSNSYHMNWLNFLSHILRSSLIYETINKSSDRFRAIMTTDEIANIVTKSMKFEDRIDALNKLNQLIKERTTKNIAFNQLDNDWLSYSIIGRADLIYFKNWLKKNRDLNF